MELYAMSLEDLQMKCAEAQKMLDFIFEHKGFVLDDMIEDLRA